MGRLYQAKKGVELLILKKKLDPYQIKGEIGMRTGIVFGLINPNTPDDQQKMEKLVKAVQDILGETLEL